MTKPAILILNRKKGGPPNETHYSVTLARQILEARPHDLVIDDDVQETTPYLLSPRIQRHSDGEGLSDMDIGLLRNHPTLWHGIEPAVDES